MKYRELDRPQAVLSLMRHLGGLWRDLPEELLIICAWAHTMVANFDQACFWLERSAGDSPLDTAWQYGLRAEIEKARRDKQAA